MYFGGELFMGSKEGHFGVYVLRCEATRDMNTIIPLGWVLAGRVRNHVPVQPVGRAKEFVTHVTT